MATFLLSVVLSSSLFCFLPAEKSEPRRTISGWTPGFVVLESNDTVACNLRYNPAVPEGLLQVSEESRVLTLSVRDVKGFFYFDRARDRVRQYLTLSVPIDGRSREIFLELVYGNDKVSILNHEAMGLTRGHLMDINPFRTAVPHNRQYLLDGGTGRLLPLSVSNALTFLERKEQVRAFIDAHDIRFRKVSDYVRIFEYDRSL